ncbi:hypothetical protein Y032_0072g684 [Ancylostoma ceylanicum]|uniref:Kazal-like domain-containing protein n=1 Tax=Ancylostoma ceylanicum TaxID=53326 RepID=A0A016TXL7_9BILA|nr:hypothetical protein Y032_0072g684 [Ancylostoma ceylanicum]
MVLHRVVLLLCAVPAALSEGVGTNCTCDKSFKPVCGSNGVTYENPCHLKCKSSEGYQKKDYYFSDSLGS